MADSTPPIATDDWPTVKAAEKIYNDSQRFICQNCTKEYEYGRAKVNLTRAVDVYKYSPLCFCSETCGDKYLHRTGSAYPPVGAEIPLSKPEKCVLPTPNDVEEAKKIMAMSGEALISAVEASVYHKDGDTVSDAKFDLMWAEVTRRTYFFDDKKEQARQDHVDAFAFSSGIAVAALWKANHGRVLTLDETKEFSQLLFNFFVGIR